MKLLRFSILLFSVCTGLVANAEQLTLGQIANRMNSTKCYKANADYQLLLPNFSDPVNYAITLQSDASADSLAPCNYIIDWTLDTPVSHSEGFSAYFDGTHFRYRDRKMQEYHLKEDRSVFGPLGDRRKGVQYQAQFTDLLPAFIAEHFLQMESDSTFQYTVTQSDVIKIKGSQSIMGYTSVEFEYILNSADCMPVSVDLINNPGQMGEQELTVSYTSTTISDNCNIDESALISAHEEEFEKYRSNSFSLEQLVGAPLPGFSAKTLDGERFARNRGDISGHPAILAFVDTEVGTTPDVIAAVRDAVNFLPMSVDVFWAFLNRRPEDVAALIGAPQPGETILINANSAARECGVGALTPAIIFVDTHGNVTDFNLGFNQDLQSVVIQKAGIIASH